jgi:hypothetical protein
MSRTLIVDTQNLYYASDKEKIDYNDMIMEHGPFNRLVALVPMKKANTLFIKYLQHAGFTVIEKSKPDWIVEITMMATLAEDVVIGSNDIRLLPLVKFKGTKIKMIGFEMPEEFQ